MDILSDKIVTTRKKHKCSACRRMFEKGTKMRTQVNTSDGIGTWRECPTCQELLLKHRSNFEDYDQMCYEGCVSEVLERGQTPEELLSALSPAVSSSFSVHTYALIDEDTPTYVHWSYGLKMIIIKDGVTMRLNSDEIEQLVKALPRTVGGSY